MGWERLPEFSARIVQRNDFERAEQINIQFVLEITNYGLQEASQLSVQWDSDDANFYEWIVTPDITMPAQFESVHHQDYISLAFECKVPLVTLPNKNKSYFAFFALELNYRQPDGQECMQVITWLDHSNEFGWLDSGFVQRSLV